MNQCCAQCAYWKKLVDTRQSYGICSVIVKDIRIPEPMKQILLPYGNMFGSTSPEAGTTCTYFQQFIALKG